MKLWHSSDWHLSFNEDGTIQKPMHERSWAKGTQHYVTYLNRIQEHAEQFIGPNDVTFITGDITHEVGMSKIIHSLRWIYQHVPGHIVLIRGNHDQRLRRDQIRKLLSENRMDDRMTFVWEQEAASIHGFGVVYCGSKHDGEGDGCFFIPKDDTAAKNADVFLCHYPVSAAKAHEIVAAYPRVQLFLSGHIHCTSNDPEIASNGIAPGWYEREAAPTDMTLFGNCLFSTGTTDVLEWKTGSVFRRVDRAISFKKPDRWTPIYDPSDPRAPNPPVLQGCGNRLVIRNGIPAMADGSSIEAYLAQCGLREGQEINICDRRVLKATIEAASMAERCS